MKGTKEQLQKAIITNDMDLVKDFYEYIFGEKAPNSVASSSSVSNEAKVYKKIIDDAVILLTRAVPPKYEIDDETNKEIKTPANQLKVTNQSDTGDMQFISSKDFELPEDNNPAYAEAMKKMPKRKKEKRPEYKPKIMSCGICGSDFDFNKEYPTGLLESGANGKIKCNKCRIG